MLEELVYLGQSSSNTIVVRLDGALVDFSPVTRMLLTFKGSHVQADSAVDSALIDWSAGNGVIEFNINDLSIEPGAYFATLVAFDPGHANGQTIVHARNRSLMFRFIAEDY